MPNDVGLFGDFLLAQLCEPAEPSATAIQVRPTITGSVGSSVSLNPPHTTVPSSKPSTAQSEQDNPEELLADNVVSQATPITTVPTQPSVVTALAGSRTLLNPEPATVPTGKPCTAQPGQDNSSEFSIADASQEIPMSTVRIQQSVVTAVLGRDNPAAPATRATTVATAFSAATKEIPSATQLGKPSLGQKEKKSSPDYLAAVTNRVAAGLVPIQQLDLRHLVPTSPAQEETTPAGPPEPAIATTSLGAETAALGISINGAPATQPANRGPIAESASSAQVPPGTHLSPASIARSNQASPPNDDNPIRPTELRFPNDAGQAVGLQIPIQRNLNLSRERIVRDSNLYVYPQPSTPFSSRAAAPAEPYESDLSRQTAWLPDAAHRTAESVLTAVGTMTPGATQKPVRGLGEATDLAASPQEELKPALVASPTLAAEPNEIPPAEAVITPGGSPTANRSVTDLAGTIGHAIPSARAESSPAPDETNSPQPILGPSRAVAPASSSAEQAMFAADIAHRESPTANRSVTDLAGTIGHAIPSARAGLSSGAQDEMNSPQSILGSSYAVTPASTFGMGSAATSENVYADFDLPARAETDQGSVRVSPGVFPAGAAQGGPADQSKLAAPTPNASLAANTSLRDASAANPRSGVAVMPGSSSNRVDPASFSDAAGARTAAPYPANRRATASLAATRNQSASETESDVKSDGGQPVSSSDATPENTRDVPEGTSGVAPQPNPAVPTVEINVTAQGELRAAAAIVPLRPDDSKVAQESPGKAASQTLRKVPLRQSTQAESSSESNDDPQPAPVVSLDWLSPQANQPRTHDATALLQDQTQPPAATADHANQLLVAPLTQTQARSGPNSSAPNGEPANTHTPEPGPAVPPEPNGAPRSATVIQTARVLERVGQTEMRIGVSAGDFGSVEVRASVTQDRLGAAIAATHQDLRAAMMAEMPALERAMEQHQLRLDQFDLSAQIGSRSGGASPQQQPQSRSGSQGSFHVPRADALSARRDEALPSSVLEPYSTRLNVHA